MCGCLTVALGAFFPRVALILIWIFGDVVQRAFSYEWLLPLVGLLFLPYTTLVYVLLYWSLGEVGGFAWFLVVLAFLVDISSYAGASRVSSQYD
ncbi:MAG: hypothetical protein U0990_05850 [Candidatus Nanopelagicales bacterium]|nr:hypothetical protein [Candidatus Nanopelagicales bacterium]MDZ4249597.1 hypothetical protein [Candidatus Nanopelagicales bacterium]MDZ7577610.1 hypothetical protein [Candidatus Nanopelagicales bacterium]